MTIGYNPNSRDRGVVAAVVALRRRPLRLVRRVVADGVPALICRRLDLHLGQQLGQQARVEVADPDRAAVPSLAGGETVIK